MKTKKLRKKKSIDRSPIPPTSKANLNCYWPHHGNAAECADMMSIAGKESLRGMRFIYAVEADEAPQPWLKEKLSTTDD